MGIDYIKEHIRSDIDSVKEEYKKDISFEIGNLINDFIYNHNQDKSRFLFENIFFREVGELEKILGKKINDPVSLHNTINSGFEICRILQQKDNQGELGELRNYVIQLMLEGKSSNSPLIL